MRAASGAIADALLQLLAQRLVMNLMYASPLFTSFEPKVRLAILADTAGEPLRASLLPELD